MSGYLKCYERIAAEDLESSLQDLEFLAKKASADFKRLGNLTGARVLEIGPGHGHLAKLISASCGQMDITDVVGTYLDPLRTNVSGKAFVADAQELEIDEEYDLVVMCDVLEHVFRPADVLLGVFRALRPGGRLYVRVPSFEPSLGYSRTLGCPWEYAHLRTYTPHLLGLELRNIGFSLVSGPTGRGAPMRVENWRLLSAGHATSQKRWLHDNQRSQSDLGKYIVESKNTRGEVARTLLLDLLKRFRLPLVSLPGEVWAIAKKPVRG